MCPSLIVCHGRLVQLQAASCNSSSATQTWVRFRDVRDVIVPLAASVGSLVVLSPTDPTTDGDQPLVLPMEKGSPHRFRWVSFTSPRDADYDENAWRGMFECLRRRGAMKSTKIGDGVVSAYQLAMEIVGDWKVIAISVMHSNM